MTFEITGRIPVAAPAEQLWDVVTDWERQDRWIPATVVRIVSGDGRSVGSKVLAFTGFADIGFVDSMEIVEWDPPRRCVVWHTGRLVRGSGVFAVEPDGDTSTFVWSERLHPPFGPLGRIGLAALRPMVRLGQRRVGRALAAECRRRSDPNDRENGS